MEQVLQAGAAQRVITPPVGVSLTGWNPRSLVDAAVEALDGISRRGG